MITTTHSLQTLIQAIALANTEAELRSLIVEQVSTYFAATRCNLFLSLDLVRADKRFQKALEIGLSIEHNPVLRYLVDHHAPVHEALVTSPKTWQIICPRADHWHVMAGPIVKQGKLIGGLGCTRQRGMPPFDPQNLTDLSALCLHVSTWMATHSERPKNDWRDSSTETLRDRLTPREGQIAQLVAQGRTNAEIGAKLWITENSVKQALKRMFRKLEVSSRAEMVAKLADASR
jgi:DNA-binding CsgD family transcriptional regulator